jgi:ribosome-associated toxin RatA of RatAB toxin-antitoxin module
VEFEIKAGCVLQGAAINAIFEDLSRQQMDAFASRAKEVPYRRTCELGLGDGAVEPRSR